MLWRNIEERIERARGDSPVVLLQGARQTGKTTLVRALAQRHEPPLAYVTLDDSTALAAAKDSPERFLERGGSDLVIDEVQRAPELFPAIKLSVDRDRRPGRFLLTGSANVLALPRLSESLAGRMELIQLWPLSRSEIRQATGPELVDALFDPDTDVPMHSFAPDRDRLWQAVLEGGYPELLERQDPERRRTWFESYLTTILQRDVRDLANIEGLTLLPRLLALLASRVGGLVNVADLGRSLSVPQTTLKRYLALLEATFLVRLLPAWFTNRAKRLAKAPKLYLVDTGLAAHLLGLESARLEREDTLRGALLENFLLLELIKQASWSDTRPDLYHFRTAAGKEVDIVLEDRRGRVVGIEVKARTRVARRDFGGLEALADAAGDRFVRGIVCYTGDQVAPFGERFLALPMVGP